jgi:hypothetical protein
MLDSGISSGRPYAARTAESLSLWALRSSEGMVVSS